MNLRDFLSADRAIVPLTATVVSEAAEELLSRVQSAFTLRDPDKVRRRLSESRTEDIVVVPARAFIVHYRGDAAAALSVALGVAPRPIGRTADAEESSRARLVVLVVAPAREAARHLQLVRAFARLASQPEALAAALAAESGQALASLPAFAEYLLPEELTVRDLMTESPRTTSPDVSVRDAARDMLLAGLSALPVVDADGRMLGLLSERELMRHLMTTALLAASAARFTPPGSHGRRTVRDVMTRQVLCVAPEQSIAEVASLMTNKDVERVPVVREGRLVGFLTRGDIVRKLIGP